MDTTTLYKNRSVTSCISAAYQFLMNHFGPIFRATWLPALTYAVATAALMALNFPDTAIAGLEESQPLASLATMVGVAIVAIVTWLWAVARLSSLLNQLPRRWNFKRVAVAFLVTVVAVVPLLVVMALPLVYVNMRYLNDKEMHYRSDFFTTYKKGLRYYGYILTVGILVAIIAMSVYLLAGLPLLVLSVAKTISMQGMAMGDPSGLPGYFLPLAAVTVAVEYFVLWFLYVFEFLVGYFVYGSIQQKHLEKTSANE